jgi:hypothetical protein
VSNIKIKIYKRKNREQNIYENGGENRNNDIKFHKLFNKVEKQGQVQWDSQLGGTALSNTTKQEYLINGIEINQKQNDLGVCWYNQVNAQLMQAIRCWN